MIRNDAAYHGANVKVVSIGGGFSYGALGISHHATEDLAIMRSLPDVTCISPTSLLEVTEATKAVTQTLGTCFLRLDKDKGPDGPIDEPFVLGRPRVLRRGHDVALIVTGGILSEVVRAADVLGRAGISASVYAVHTLKPFGPDHIIEAARIHRALVTVEEHTIHGGLGGLVLETLADAGVNFGKFLRIGLDGCFSSVVGSQSYLRHLRHGRRRHCSAYPEIAFLVIQVETPVRHRRLSLWAAYSVAFPAAVHAAHLVAGLLQPVLHRAARTCPRAHIQYGEAAVDGEER
jgi:transketolase